MDLKEIKRNRLDLEYKKYLQVLNGLFLILTSGAFGIISSIIYLKDSRKIRLGLSVSAIVLMILFILIRNLDERLNEVLEEIENI